jgi:hypothetical protein
LYLQDGDNSTHTWSYAASGTADAALTWTEAMRIDSSGNLLVGTTDTTLYNNTTGGGFSVSSNGFTQIAKQGVDSADPVLILNQTGLDGEIQRFYKDGVAVGSIGAYSGDVYIAEGDTGLRFNADNDLILPFNGTSGSLATRDAAIDLGASGGRFKDLYLSGGAYLGGTAAANKLDDYEEGTWTPDVRFGNANTGITYNNQSGRYVKIGKQVTVRWGFRFSSKGTATGSVAVNGLPFTVESISYTDHVGTAGGASYTGATSGLHTIGENNGTRLFIYDSSASASTNLDDGNFNDTSYMFGVLVYFTSD